ncbi:MAG: hypothetical protein AUF76_03550 [Acidobacteria bacterium 13_1_20CM_2_65_9]|nr:MAG: hypothetical protein AUF76_03550 [Acidobacteria bacterium 13_1_20CM_2_65_9]
MTRVRPARSFQTKFFYAAFTSAVIALAVAGALFATTMRRQIDARIENTLVAEARLAADLLARGTETSDGAALDDEADRIGELIGARVTFIAADGRVVGDSSVPLDALPALENHAQRPEVVEARATGLGRSRRYSETLKIDMSYVGVPVKHPVIAFVRVALPVTTIRQQLRPVLTATLVALSVALIGGALIAWMFSARVGQRVRLIAGVARRYRSGDLTPPRLGFGDDELGDVARALDDSVQEIGRRLEEQARDRGRMEAILAGMVEGVIVVDAQGKLQLVNHAARHMLKLDEPVIGRAYVETIRHPAIAELVAAVLFGRAPEPLQLSPPRDPSRTILARAAAATGTGMHGVVLVLLDITDLRRADQIRRDFVANVSHELRTPLTAIRGYVEALTDGAASADESRRFLEIITRHTERMERLVKDLLRDRQRRHGRHACGRATRPAVRRHRRVRRRGGARRSGEAARCAAESRRERHHVRARAVDDSDPCGAARRPGRPHGVG